MNETCTPTFIELLAGHTDTKNMYVIEGQSGVNQFRRCLLGQGETETAAWLDALGPKPWSEYTKKVKKSYTCRKLDKDESPQHSHED